MRKMISMYVSIVCLLAIFLWWQSNNPVELQSDIEITKVRISTSSGFGKVNTDVITVIDDDETLETFRRVLSSAVKEEGIADMAEPVFDLKISYKKGNKAGYHLWLGEKGQSSTLMNVNDTHTTYRISEELTNLLIDLVQ